MYSNIALPRSVSLMRSRGESASNPWSATFSSMDAALFEIVTLAPFLNRSLSRRTIWSDGVTVSIDIGDIRRLTQFRGKLPESSRSVQQLNVRVLPIGRWAQYYNRVPAVSSRQLPRNGSDQNKSGRIGRCAAPTRCLSVHQQRVKCPGTHDQVQYRSLDSPTEALTRRLS